MHLAIDASFDAVPAVGDAVRYLCISEGLDASEASLVELAVVEALHNIIEHGYAGGPGRVQVDVTVDRDRICADIRDTAPAVDLGRIVPRPLPPADAGCVDRAALDERGRGLDIIRGVFDHVSFIRSASGNHLALSRARRRGTP
jgi:anti-sigma regulatory factor (Ser/Thr protein kinase)